MVNIVININPANFQLAGVYAGGQNIIPVVAREPLWGDQISTWTTDGPSDPGGILWGT